VIECCEWRADSYPYGDHSRCKSGEPPAADEAWEGASKRKPTAKVDPLYDQRQRGERERPRLHV
jgi:hypothetical protein